MSKEFKAIVAVIQALKDEFGVSSSDAYRVIKQDRVQERIGRQAAEIGKLLAVPTAASVGRICYEIFQYSTEYLDYLFELLKRQRLLLKDNVSAPVSDWCDERVGIIQVNYPAAVAQVCEQNGVEIKPEHEAKCRKDIITVVTQEPIFRLTGTTEWRTLHELALWIRTQTQIFLDPDSPKVVQSLLNQIEDEATGGFLSFEEGEKARTELAPLLARSLEMRLQDCRAKILSLVAAPMPRLNPSLLGMFIEAGSYTRANRELTLNRLWVRRRIALEGVISEVKIYDSRISDGVIDKVLEEFERRRNKNRELLEDLKHRKAPSSIIEGFMKIVCRYEYYLEVIRENRRWMRKLFTS